MHELILVIDVGKNTALGCRHGHSYSRACVLSLIGIVTGLVVLYGLLTSNRMDGWTLVFLFSTVATSVTGFFFPFKGVTPAIILGILSLVVLAAAIAARYAFHLAGSSR